MGAIAIIFRWHKSTYTCTAHWESHSSRPKLVYYYLSYFVLEINILPSFSRLFHTWKIYIEWEWDDDVQLVSKYVDYYTCNICRFDSFFFRGALQISIAIYKWLARIEKLCHFKWDIDGKNNHKIYWLIISRLWIIIKYVSSENIWMSDMHFDGQWFKL